MRWLLRRRSLLRLHLRRRTKVWWCLFLALAFATFPTFAIALRGPLGNDTKSANEQHHGKGSSEIEKNEEERKHMELGG